jgi:hypothetical protein
VQASVDDLVKWVNFLDNGLTTKMHEILNTKFTTNKGDTIKYQSYGQFFGDYGGNYRIEHLGLALGFRAAIARFPEQKKSIIFLANDGNEATFNRYYQICSAFLKNVKKNPLKLGEFPDLENSLAQVKANSMPVIEEDLSDATGNYFSKELKSIYSLNFKDHHLTIHLPRIETLYLKAKDENGVYNTNVFTRRYSLKFERNANGVIIGFFLFGGGMKDFWFEKIK